MKIKVPCKDCVLIVICKNKLFDELIKDCKLLLDSLYFDKTTSDGSRSTYYGDKIYMVQNILRPDLWEVIIDPKDKFVNVISGHTTLWCVGKPQNFQLKRKVRAKSGEILAKMIRKRKYERGK